MPKIAYTVAVILVALIAFFLLPVWFTLIAAGVVIAARRGLFCFGKKRS